jgi:hypothetical protein
MKSAEEHTSDTIVMVIQVPKVLDASGATVPASLSVEGSTITMTVTRSESTTWPATAEIAAAAPSDRVSATKAPGAQYGFSDPHAATFGHEEEKENTEHKIEKKFVDNFDSHLKSGPLDVKRARLFLNWDASPENKELLDWLKAVKAAGLTPFITLRECEPTPESPCPADRAPKTLGEYYNHVKKLMKGLVNGSGERPAVRLWGAWNEPDRFENAYHVSPAGPITAAYLWGEAQRASESKEVGCHNQCKVVAGEFETYEHHLYVKHYEETIIASERKHHFPTKVKPHVWGIHDYTDLEDVKGVKDGTKEVLGNYVNKDAQGFVRQTKKLYRSAHIWLTEQGVLLQKETKETRLFNNPVLQRLAAQDFLQLGRSSEHTEWVYYYLYHGPAKWTPSPTETESERKQHEKEHEHTFDSALLPGEGVTEEDHHPAENPRQAYCILALGDKEGCPATGATEAAITSTVTSSAGTVTLDVNPWGSPTDYFIEYGKTTAYGHTTTSTAVNNENGEQSETVALSELEPCTTYHYQAEAENEANDGTPSLGGDKTFTTGCGGIISRVAGDEHLPSSLEARKDGGPATEAGIYWPISVATGPGGNVYIGEKGWAAVRKVNGEGVISTVAGKPEGGWGEYGNPADEGSATSIHIGWPWGLATAGDGTLYIADADDQEIRAVSPEGALTTYAGTRPAINGEVGEHETAGPCSEHEGLYSGDGGPAREAGFASPGAVAVGSDGSLYIADGGEDAIRKVAPDGDITTFAGFYNSADETWFEYFEYGDPEHLACEFYSYEGVGEASGDGGPATSAVLGNPEGVAVGPDGSVYIAEGGQNIVRRVEPDGTITTFAGDGTAGYSGDGGPATSAELNKPEAVAVGPEGSLFVADACNAVVRRISPLGTITTVAGDGANGSYGYVGQATSAKLEAPRGIAVDEAGNLFIAGGFSSGSEGEVLKVDAPLGPGSTTDSDGGSGCHSGGGGGAD